MRSILVCSLLWACGDGGGGGNGDDGGGGDSVDVDEDGYDVPADCNDDDPDIHPDQAEQCDGIDQDCDGDTDENPTDGTSFYPDADNDGFGSSQAPLVSCDAPDGYADNSDDCNDGDAALNPSTPWYTDNDGDGYGTVLEISGCVAPGGTAPVDGDCDDLEREQPSRRRRGLRCDRQRLRRPRGRGPGQCADLVPRQRRRRVRGSGDQRGVVLAGRGPHRQRRGLQRRRRGHPSGCHRDVRRRAGRGLQRASRQRVPGPLRERRDRFVRREPESSARR